jgi:GT2 family glycosyltransferase
VSAAAGPGRPVSAAVVVISKNERDLDETLTALEQHESRHPVELVVVDASAGRLADLAERHPAVRWIDYSPPGGAPRPGKRVTIPEQRNLGIAATTGEVVVFVDAGCDPAPGWLDALLAPIQAGRESVVIGGRHNVRDDRYTVAATGEHYVEDAPTLNFACTRTALDAVGRFDERYSYGSDIDLCWRLDRAGYRLLMVPAAQVSVHWGDTRRQVKRAWRYGSARARLYRTHPDRLASLPRRDPILVIYPLFLLGLPVILLAPWHPVVLAYPLLLAVPAWRARRSRPVLTVVDHLVFGAGALAHLVAGVA